MTPPTRILVADDQEDILSSAKLLFKGEGLDCATASSPSEVTYLLGKKEFDLVLLDLNYKRDTTSGKEGLELIEKIRSTDQALPIVVMTAWASVDVAVEAMKLGANDFITKPWDVERLLTIVKNQSELRRALLREEKLQIENRILLSDQSAQITYESNAMAEVLRTLEQVASSDARILITGENGTGKSLLAHTCHQMSNRHSGPFISINMGGLPENLFESELFGHERGAFTDAKKERIGRYELADGGTLFLDEIGNLTLNHQTTLLRLLESGEFERVGSSKTRQADVRIICATNSNLTELISEGKFREDLYYRINTVPVHIPPLRERRQDIMPLANEFLETYRIKYKKNISGFSDELTKLLESYQWPGNVRELDHAIERAVLLSRDDRILPETLSISPSTENSADFDELTLDDAEKMILERAFTKYRKNPNEAAEALGISRSAFYRKLKKYDIQ